jgi:hypothetical protein
MHFVKSFCSAKASTKPDTTNPNLANGQDVNVTSCQILGCVNNDNNGDDEISTLNDAALEAAQEKTELALIDDDRQTNGFALERLYNGNCENNNDAEVSDRNENQCNCTKLTAPDILSLLKHVGKSLR